MFFNARNGMKVKVSVNNPIPVDENTVKYLGIVIGEEDKGILFYNQDGTVSMGLPGFKGDDLQIDPIPTTGGSGAV